MDYKKSKAPSNTVTRDVQELWKSTGNIYESVAIIAKRANQISVEIKQDLSKKLAEFASYNDSLDEVFENREQIEIRSYQSQHCWLPRSSWMVMFTGVILLRMVRKRKIFSYDTEKTNCFPLPCIACYNRMSLSTSRKF